MTTDAKLLLAKECLYKIATLRVFGFKSKNNAMAAKVMRIEAIHTLKTIGIPKWWRDNLK